MSSFSVFANTAYNISVAAPGVAGNPAPTLSYRWIYNGIEIGTSRVITEYTFPSLPGTLSCTVTATNWGGSVSQTATASISERQAVPSLNPVSIRLQSAPTAIVASLPSAAAGDVLLCGGPISTDLSPTGTNIGSLSYQWKRNNVSIAAATDQKYTLTSDDTNAIISVMVTAVLGTETTSTAASIATGTFAINANSRMGTQGSPPTYYTSQVAFVNLAYSSFNNLGDVVRSTNSPDWNGGLARFVTTNSAHLPHFTQDGWPRASSAGPISGSSTRAAGPLLLNDSPGAPRLRSILNLQEPWNAPSRPVRFKISTYWQGTGYAHANPGNTGGGTQVPVTTVFFSGPDGDGPFGTGADVPAEARGPITMSRTVYQHERNTQDINGLQLTILDSSQSDPVRNIVILVHDVETQDADGNWTLVYSGFDHTTYRPFQLYPAFIEANRHFRVWRFMSEAFVQGTNGIISQDTGVPFESMTWDNQVSTSSSVQQTVWNTGWSAVSTTLGVEYGFEAINRPTHALFGRSLRAAIEICNGLSADMWWCHPHTVAWAGSSGVPQTDGSHICKTNAETGSIQVDQEYIAGFATEITSHLRPELALLNEWSNETWNEASAWILQTLYASSMYRRLIASQSEGGDGLPFAQTRARGALSGWHAAISAWNVVAISAIGREVKARIAGRDVVAIYGGQSAFFARNRDALGWVEYTMPVLFKELDAIAHAPYRTPPRGDFPADHLAEWTATGSWWRTGTVDDNHPQGSNLPHFLRWKGLALDMSEVSTPSGGWSGAEMRSYAPSSARRWNLKLFTYEGGQHDEPATADQQAITFAQQYDPRYFDFYTRYFETVFAPGPRGLLDPLGDPAGVELHDLSTNAGPEPIHDLFTHYRGIDRYFQKWFWGSKQFNGETEAPKAEAIADTVTTAPWSST